MQIVLIDPSKLFDITNTKNFQLKTDVISLKVGIV
jgi:hypothetical protein